MHPAPATPMHTTSAPSSLTRTATGPFGLLCMLVGPVLTVLAARLYPGWELAMQQAFATVALIMWSPLLPIGFPALLLQDERDRCTTRRGVARAVTVTAHLTYRGPGRVVAATWVNVFGLLLAATAI